MRARDCLLYLVGHREGIQAVAASRAAIPTGAALVLLTAIARNYDQTFIGESPFFWLFGPLLFSFVSGWWLYAVVYGWCVRRWRAPGDAAPTDKFWSGWPAFLGLFWMTAPIAWLYALPVERFLGDVPAAKVNVALLATVALWRVLLMARTFSVLCRVNLFLTLSSVLVAAAVEVMVVAFFGGGIAKRIAASMGGMRNSPAEDILLGAMGTAFMGALFVGPVVLIIALLCCPREDPEPFPIPVPGRAPGRMLLVAAVVWAGLAIVPQIELSRSVHVEQLVHRKEWRAALDYLATRQPGDFAPARALPPKPFERELFTDLPPLLGAVRESDPAWVRGYLFQRLDQLVEHLGPRWRRRAPPPGRPFEEQVKDITSGLQWHRQSPPDWASLLKSISSLPEGRAWLGSNPALLESWARTVAEKPWTARWRDAGSESDWRALAAQLVAVGATNAALTNLLARPADTNAPPAAAR